MNPTEALTRLDAELARLHEEFTATRPLSGAAHRRAMQSLPGGNTRSVLHFKPYPLTMARGVGSEVWDVDGHRYIDFVGEFSAGLFGHSDPRIRAAIAGALDTGLVMAAPGAREAELAELIRARFPSIERLRFCNSGTEANILAIATAKVVTGRRKIMVFDGAYHGGVLVFSRPHSPLNIELDVVSAPYNDKEAAERMIREHGKELAAVIVEPILGAAGNLPGSPEFLHALRAGTSAAGALLIFDEVKTSRCGAGGMQGLHGIRPDITTLGKYMGGGLACGVFGGSEQVMSRYDPYGPAPLRHAGTFNNNACGMAAGIAGLRDIFTPERADSFNARGERLRAALAATAREAGAAAVFTGHGSMISIHFARAEPRRPAEIPAVSARLVALFHMHALLSGVLMANRGDIFMSLSNEAQHEEALVDVTGRFLRQHRELIDRLLPAATNA
jgi:glutamate-1-semialdehyde 2,1-aminomutase